MTLIWGLLSLSYWWVIYVELSSRKIEMHSKTSGEGSGLKKKVFYSNHCNDKIRDFATIAWDFQGRIYRRRKFDNVIVFDTCCYYLLGLPWRLKWWRICLQCRRPRFDPCVGKIPWRREWQLTPVFLPGKTHAQRSLTGCSPWGHKESDTTEYSHIHTGLIVRCIIILCSTKKLKMLTNVIVRCHQL